MELFSPWLSGSLLKRYWLISFIHATIGRCVPYVSHFDCASRISYSIEHVPFCSLVQRTRRRAINVIVIVAVKFNPWRSQTERIEGIIVNRVASSISPMVLSCNILSRRGRSSKDRNDMWEIFPVNSEQTNDRMTKHCHGSWYFRIISVLFSFGFYSVSRNKQEGCGYGLSIPIEQVQSFVWFSGKDECPAAGIRIFLPYVAVEPVAAQFFLLQWIQWSCEEAIIVDGRGRHLGHV